VFYTVYGSEEERTASAAALASAAGLIRSEVGRQTGVKHTPSITFKQDTIPDTARNIEELVARARMADAEVAAARVGAEPAGDPDPYRVRPEPDGDDDAEPKGEGEMGGGPAAEDAVNGAGEVRGGPLGRYPAP
jgi:ribosome-binding factor A